MKNIMNKMMLSCDKATILMEKRLDTELSLMEKLNLSFHTSMCSGCRNYKKQSRIIHDLLRSGSGKAMDNIQEHIIARLKLDIINKLAGTAE